MALFYFEELKGLADFNKFSKAKSIGIIIATTLALFYIYVFGYPYQCLNLYFDEKDVPIDNTLS